MSSIRNYFIQRNNELKNELKALISENKAALADARHALQESGLKRPEIIKHIQLLESIESMELKESDWKEIGMLEETILSLCNILQATLPPDYEHKFYEKTTAQAKLFELIKANLDKFFNIYKKPMQKYRQLKSIQALEALEDLPKKTSRLVEQIASCAEKKELKAEMIDEIVLADHLVLNAGNPDELKALIEKNPRLLFNVTQSMNAAGMKVKGTLYQKALGSNDLEMADTLQRLLLAYDPEAEKKQRTEQFPLDWKETAKVKLNELLVAVDEVIDKVITAGSVDAKNQEKELDSAFENFKHFIEVQNKKVLTTGIYSNLELLVETMHRLETNIAKFKDYPIDKEGSSVRECYGSLKASYYCDKVYGLIQAKMITPRDANEIIRGVINFDINNPAPRNLKITASFSYYDQIRNCDLGDNFYLDIFGLPQAPAQQLGHGKESNPNNYNRKLFNARIDAVETFCNEERINQLRKEIPLKQMSISPSTDEAPKKLSDGTLLHSEETKKAVATFGTFRPKPSKEESTASGYDSFHLR